MDGKQRREFLESLSDFTLYETFYEAGTMLGGGRWSSWSGRPPNNRIAGCSAVSAENVSAWATIAMKREEMIANDRSGS